MFAGRSAAGCSTSGCRLSEGDPAGCGTADCGTAVPDDIVMVFINAHWEEHHIKLPRLPEHLRWSLIVDTGLGVDCIVNGKSAFPGLESGMQIKDRSVVVLTAVKLH